MHPEWGLCKVRGSIWEQAKKPGNPSPSTCSCHSLQRVTWHHYQFLHRWQQRGGTAGCREDLPDHEVSWWSPCWWHLPSRVGQKEILSLFLKGKSVQRVGEEIINVWVKYGRPESSPTYCFPQQRVARGSYPQVQSSGQLQWSWSLLSSLLHLPKASGGSRTASPRIEQVLGH